MWRSGPATHEITQRVTYDAKSGEVLDVEDDYVGLKLKSEKLPEPTPRAIRTVFHFKSTSANIPSTVQGPAVKEGAPAI